MVRVLALHRQLQVQTGRFGHLAGFKISSSCHASAAAPSMRRGAFAAAMSSSSSLALEPGAVAVPSTKGAL